MPSSADILKRFEMTQLMSTSLYAEMSTLRRPATCTQAAGRSIRARLGARISGRPASAPIPSGRCCGSHWCNAACATVLCGTASHLQNCAALRTTSLQLARCTSPVAQGHRRQMPALWAATAARTSPQQFQAPRCRSMRCTTRARRRAPPGCATSRSRPRWCTPQQNKVFIIKFFIILLQMAWFVAHFVSSAVVDSAF